MKAICRHVSQVVHVSVHFHANAGGILVRAAENGQLLEQPANFLSGSLRVLEMLSQRHGFYFETSESALRKKIIVLKLKNPLKNLIFFKIGPVEHDETDELWLQKCFQGAGK
jgi:hypothetical protein